MKTLLLFLTTVLAASAQPNLCRCDFSQGLVGYWKMDTLSALTNNAVRINNFVIVNSASLTNHNGILLGCASNKSTARMESSVAEFGGSRFTVSFWMFPISDTTSLIPLSLSGGSTLQKLHFRRFQCYYSTNGTTASAVSYTAPSNQWNHVVAVAETNWIKVFVNGSLSSSNTLVNPINAVSNRLTVFLHYGAYADSYFVGSVDEVAFWSEPKSADFIYHLYNFGAGRFLGGQSGPNPNCAPQNGLTNGLVAYWKFDAGALTTDSWGGNTLSTPGNVPIEATGIINGCATNTASIGFYRVASNNFTATTFTFSCWVRCRNVAGTTGIAGQDGSAPARKWYLQFISSTIRCTYSADGSSLNAIGNYPVANETWYNVVYVSTGSQIQMYVNGQLHVSAARSLFSAAQSLNLMYTGQDNGLPGSIDEAAWWNRALNPGEIVSIYNRGRGKALTDFGRVEP